MILILMGVSGTGKTTLGEMLAADTGWPFLDGDDFHPAANKAKMASGVPLTDEDRAPWLVILHGKIEGVRDGERKHDPGLQCPARAVPRHTARRPVP